MSFDDDLRRLLHAKAAGVRVAPDLGELGGRIRSSERRAARHERWALGAAAVVLAASLGGLAGAVVSSPRAKPSNSLSSRYTAGGSQKPLPSSSMSPKHGSTRPGTSEPVPRTVIDEQLPGGLSLTATVQRFVSPVAISGERGSSTECGAGEFVTTTVGQSGSFGGGISVAELPKLAPGGLEILSSGILQASGASPEWWVTATVGSGVIRVAAENVGAQPVTAVPSDGIVVIAGPVSQSGVEMSAVAEGFTGDESLGFSLGSGPNAVGTTSVGDEPGCSPLRLPFQPSSASSSQPTEPSLAASSIISAFEQADSANPLLGFAANLAAVNDGGQLSSPATTSGRPPSAKASAVAPTSGGGIVDVQQVAFLSASMADVVYRVNDGVLLTGVAQLGPSGIWRMALDTFCSNLRSDIVEGDVPQGVLAACER